MTPPVSVDGLTPELRTMIDSLIADPRPAAEAVDSHIGRLVLSALPLAGVGGYLLGGCGDEAVGVRTLDLALAMLERCARAPRRACALVIAAFAAATLDRPEDAEDYLKRYARLGVYMHIATVLMLFIGVGMPASDLRAVARRAQSDLVRKLEAGS